MPVRRSKKHRIKAAQKRKEVISTSPTVKPAAKSEVSDLLHFDTKLIKKDLVRTLISTLVVFGVLVALYYQL